MRVQIDEITVGERMREDLGNLTMLAESLQKYGLVHPIVIDEDLRLIAGQRRLEAAKMVGWTEIDVVYKTDLTEGQKRILELEENLHRKDLNLTEYEKSKNLIELAELKAEELRNRSPADQFISHKGGRGKKAPDSLRKIAEEIGVSKTTLIEAQKHDEAIDQYPELKDLPKTHAIQIARQLNTLPEEEREKALQDLEEVQETGKRRLKQIDNTYKIKKVFDDALYGTATLEINDNRLDVWLSGLDSTEMQRKWELVEEGIENLTALKEHFKKIFGGPRVVEIRRGSNK